MSHAAPLRFHATAAAGAAAPSPWPWAAPPTAHLMASVVVPAKDEVASIEATLAALAAQTDTHGRPLPPGSFEVLLLANNCADATAQVARAFGARHPHLTLHVAELQLPTAEAHVGRARQLLMDEACRRLELSRAPIRFIASTDADTRVAPTWLAATAAALRAGADAVGGRILMSDPAPGCPVRRCQLHDAAYHLLRCQLETRLDPADHDPWPRHHQHFGASLALTPAAYRRVGGLPAVPFLEDEALYQALLRHDLRVRHCPAVRVFTSGRQQGRVAVGLSWQLREWARLAGQPVLVPHPAALATELRARRALREAWATPSHAITLPPALRDLVGQQAQFATFGAFWEWARPHLLPEAGQAAVPVGQAIAELRQLLAAQPGVAVPSVVS